MAALDRRWQKRRGELRRRLQERGEWRPELREPLERYVRAMAMAQRLWDELQAADGLTDRGSAGQPRVRPLVAAFVDAQRAADLLGARLGLVVAPPPRSVGRPKGSVPLDRLQPAPSQQLRVLQGRNGH
jgi:hypothetical protein